MIKVIGRENCSICKEVKELLEGKGISFEYSLITEHSQEVVNEIIRKASNRGITTMPIILENDDILTVDELKAFLRLKITKRNGQVRNFDKGRIVNAINNAMFETGEIDNNLAEVIADEIENESDNLIQVEDIQDVIVKKLNKYDRKDISSRYVEYRKKKAKEREIKDRLNKKEGLLSDEFISKYKHTKPPFTPLGEFVYYRTYSRWLPEFNRREYWWETVRRVVEYNCSLLPTSVEEAQRLYDNMFNLKQFPSGRSLWIANTKSAEEFPLANFNCSFVVIDSFDKFCEQFHALLVGAGVGFRVLLEDVEQMPIPRSSVEIIHKPYKSIRKRYRDENTSLHIKQHNAIIEIGDSKSGWIKSLKFYFDILTDKDYSDINTITFDYDNVRPYGEKLQTFGGRASGHESMKNMITKINRVIQNRNGKLKPIDCIDISNIIAENVVVGGVRRSAEIGLIDANDKESIQAKNGLYTEVDGKWIENKSILHRRMSNNTIVYEEKPTREQLHWNLEQMRYSGEPAFMNMKEAKRRNPNAKGLNPCAEIILDDRGTCNLSVVNLMAFANEDGTYDKEGILEAQRLSARLCYRMTCVELEMHEWAKTQTRDRLLGCDITGTQDFINATKMTRDEFNALCRELRSVARETMKEIAKENGLSESLLVTAGKPNGSLALLPTVSAGIHFSHSPYYIRRVRISSNDPLCKVVEDLGYPIYPEVGQDMETADTKVIEFPVKSPEGRTKYDVSAIEQLEIYKDMMENYIEMNQSITVTVKNDEWEAVEDWLWKNWDTMVAVSFLPLDDSYYPLLPYEACSEEEYNNRVSEMKSFNPELIQKYEKEESEEDLEQDYECTSGACGLR